jgi:SAM-dependent methyltransferase
MPVLPLDRNDPGSSYSREFFAGQREGSDRSAQRVVGLVMDLVSPRSVVDVGCGVGAWLAAFAHAGVERIVGFDGDYVPRDMLKIPVDRFVAANLREPLPISERFELAMSLEVAEHLPAEVADRFVETLCELAPVVLFSAAIPLQGGTEHINERAQSWWAAKFQSRGFRAIDAIRPEIWDDESVKFWYRQNMLMYASEDAMRSNARLRELADRTNPRMLDVVHPSLLAQRNEQPILGLSEFCARWARRTGGRWRRKILGKA